MPLLGLPLLACLRLDLGRPQILPRQRPTKTTSSRSQSPTGRCFYSSWKVCAVSVTVAPAHRPLPLHLFLDL